MEHKEETRNCQNCKNNFTIEPEDFDFYEKIKVPPQILCSDCKMVRKYIWRNERTLYRRNCDKTGKSMVSIYAPDSKFTVYDISEWWSDSWDAKDYAMEYDASRSFFEQFKELQTKVPRLALLNKNCINSDFSNHVSGSKDVYMSTAVNSENVMYSTNVIPAKNSCDCYRTDGTSNENLYESINVYNSYNCQYCFLIQDSFDCYYSVDLKNCSNCFLSYNLRGQSYIFMNQKYSKDQYLKKVEEFNLKSYKDREVLYKAWLDIFYNKALHKNVIVESSVNSTGNFIFNSKNAVNCVDVEDLENCSNVHVATTKVKDSYDLYHVGYNIELSYESHAIARSSNCKFIHLSYDNTNFTYCDSCHNSNELFGCAGVKKGSYMILNKQYTKEEYFELKEKIIQDMKIKEEYGEFFPPNLSPFSYNETQAQVYFPLAKEEALNAGYTWKDSLPGTYGKETINPEDLPDSIDEVDESIKTQVLKCIKTGRNYNITNQELEFYKTHNIPIPRLHPDERYKNRIKIRPSRKLYDTVCAISGVSIKTAYPQENRPKMIVNEEEYRKNVL